ncbi:MAG: J domain-containing protein [Synergistaceae bacterium]|jgi:hypothetical protein|nr:J domain-containing protein [Synergistaceae bacterium]
MLEWAWKTLKIERDAAPETVRQAYVRLVRRYPPEHFPEKFAAVRRAYQQLTLDDDFIEEIFPRVTEETTPLSLAGFLWGDRDELRPNRDVTLADLIPLLTGADTRNALDEALEKAASGKIEWRTGRDTGGKNG